MSIRTNGAISNLAGTGPATLTKQQAAKAHALMDQTSGAVLGSFGVSSLTDVSVGNFLVNLTTAMASTGYATPCGGYPDGFGTTVFSWPNAASSLNARAQTSGAYTDTLRFSAVAQGDLA